MDIFTIYFIFIPFTYNQDGYCGEDSLYRYKFEVYSCDWNSEADPDFQCIRKVGNFWSYIGLKKLECEMLQPDVSTQNKVTQQIPDTLSIINSAIQIDMKTYKIIDWEIGDINRDGQEDFVVLIDTTTQESSFDNRTILLIETISKSPLKIKVVAQNSKLIACSDCGGAGVGDPYRGMSIKNGVMTFKQLFGACCKDEETVAFSYDGDLNDWLLSSKEKLSYCCNQEENDEIATVFTTETSKDFGIIKFDDF